MFGVHGKIKSLIRLIPIFLPMGNWKPYKDQRLMGDGSQYSVISCQLSVMIIGSGIFLAMLDFRTLDFKLKVAGYNNYNP